MSDKISNSLGNTQSVKYSGPRVIDWTEVVDAHTSWVDAWQPEVDAMIGGAADEAQLQQRKRGAQRSANISKTAVPESNRLLMLKNNQRWMH